MSIKTMKSGRGNYSSTGTHFIKIRIDLYVLVAANYFDSGIEHWGKSFVGIAERNFVSNVNKSESLNKGLCIRGIPFKKETFKRGKSF